MDSQSDIEDTKNVQVNPYALVKPIAMTVPTLGKIEIIGKRSH